MNNNNNMYTKKQNTIISGPPLTLEDLEVLRKNAIKELMKHLIIFGTASIIIFIFSYISFHAEPTALFMLLFGSMILSYILSGFSIKEYKAAYKKYFAVSIFEKKCNNVNFNLDCGINEDIIADTHMMYMGDRFRSNDYISGTYKGVNFEYSDVHIEEEYTDSDGDTHYQTLFLGQWFIFDFNKNFKSNLQICESGFRNAKRNSWFGPEKYKKVTFEDIEFNKMFKVFAQNDLEAFYILTPHTIENIKVLNSNIQGSLLFCFIDNRLHVGLHSGKDSFEASIFKKVDEVQAKSKVSQEIDTILKFIDILNLDNTLFK